MQDTDVAIIGGGLAGLHAAWLLHKAGADVQLLEARDRLGGRILSIGQDAAEGPFDLGPSWFWPVMQPAMGALVTTLGLSAFEQYAEGAMMLERGRGRPPERHPGYRQEPPSMRVEGGSAAVILALAEAIPDDRLRLSTQVRALRRDGREVVLDLGAHSLRARQVILAVPPRVAAAQIVFAPVLPAEALSLWSRTPTWMAPHAKFVAQYDRPFWRVAGLSGMGQSMIGPMGEVHDATSANGEAALFGFIGIHAKARLEAGETAIVEACVAQLVRLFGPEAAHPRATFYKDWAFDALTATSIDLASPGHPEPSRDWIVGPWADVLSLGGSETALSDPGYLSGAVDASARAVHETLSRLGKR